MINYRLLTGAIAAAALLTTLSSCSDTFDPSSTSDRQGRILVSVGLDKEVAAPRAMSKAPATAADAISVSDLKLRLSSTDGAYTQTWESVDQMPVSAEYPVGAYLFEAFYGDEAAEGFESPYYYGSQSLTVLENKSTPVSLTASLANSMVTVIYTDAVKDYFANVSGQVESSTGMKTAYPTDETRAVYVKPGSTTVSVDVTKQSGVAAKLSPVTFNAEPRHHYTVTFDVNGGETGKGTLTVTFNSALEEEEVLIDLSDEILTAPAPTIGLSGFQSAETLTFVEGAKGDNLRATIVAQAGLGTVVMTTSSASRLRQGWPAEVDFATADAGTLAKLRELGLQFPGLEGTYTQMALLDFSNVISHIAYVEGGDNTTEINIVAKDKATKSSDPVSLKVAIEKLALEVVNIEPLEPDETELKFDVSYNGSDFEQTVGFQIRNERNTWEDVAPVSVTPLSRAASVYRVVLPVSGDGNVVFRVVRGEMTTEESLVSRNVIGAVVNDVDVFATHATLTLTDEGAVADGVQLLLSTDGVNFTPTAATPSGNTLAFSNLTPGTSYTAKVEKDGVRSKKLTFTTEAAAQLPNGDMNTEPTINGSASHWENYVFPAPWGTNNAMTTSQGGNYAYCRISGTIPENGRSGKVALIRTVGWGSGNTATGSGGGSGSTKYVDAGLLHIGANRSVRPNGYGDREGALTTDDLGCGMEFASRPSSISFWYKYVAKNSSDKGYAEIWVKDADGNTISGNVVNLDAIGDFKEISLPLSYAKNASKAAKIYVKFLSTNDRTFLQKNDANLSGPGFGGNFGNGTFMGSQLYIDDVVLNY